MNISINPIQKIGHLMRTDAADYLINECNWEAIQLPWLTLVEALRSICIETLGYCLAIFRIEPNFSSYALTTRIRKSSEYAFAILFLLFFHYISSALFRKP